MDIEVRNLFKAERDRLLRTQTQVADKSGIGQGMISQIEIDPDYEPSLTVFRKALRGIDHTLPSFFAQIEGVVAPSVQQAAPREETPSREEQLERRVAILEKNSEDLQKLVDDMAASTAASVRKNTGAREKPGGKVPDLRGRRPGGRRKNGPDHRRHAP